MKLIAMLLYMWLTYSTVESSLCRVPDVYEFCSALQSTSTHATSTIPEQQIQPGKPGKRGKVGIPGPRGVKGDRGEQGSCKILENRIGELEVKIKKFELIPKLIYCGMGMKNGAIPDSSITASAHIDFRFASLFGRLDEQVILSPTESSITSAGSWCTAAKQNEWIQVDLGFPKSVSGIVTQGRPKNHWGSQNWVTSYKISCGNTAESMEIITVNGEEKIFSGNTDKDTKVINKFPRSRTCRFIRLHVLAWNTENTTWVGPCLRLEVLKGECYEIL